MVQWAKTTDDAKNLENSVKESTGVWGATCKESVVRNWGGPPLHEKKKLVKMKPISLDDEVVECRKGVGGDGSTDNNTDNITVFRKASLL